MKKEGLSSLILKGAQAYSPYRAIEALCEDVLADLVGRKPESAIDGPLKDWVFKASSSYARSVIDNPFHDILGAVYMELGSRYHRSGLGQFFSPSALGEAMAVMSGVGERLREKARRGQMLSIGEPTCGSGALLLASMKACQDCTQDDIRHLRIVANDLDRLCVLMTATQVLSNAYFHLPGRSLGELIVTHGNGLSNDQKVFMRATHPSHLRAA